MGCRSLGPVGRPIPSGGCRPGLVDEFIESAGNVRQHPTTDQHVNGPCPFDPDACAVLIASRCSPTRHCPAFVPRLDRILQSKILDVTESLEGGCLNLVRHRELDPWNRLCAHTPLPGERV